MARDNTQLYPSVTASSKVIQVIQTITRVGKGTEDEPRRFLKQYWSLGGELLAENDPYAKTESSDGDAPPKGSAKSLPFGWDTGVGARGPRAEDMLVDHVIYWLRNCQRGGERDPAGNVYFGVDAFIISQTVELLTEHRDYLVCKTREKAEDAMRRRADPAVGDHGDCQWDCDPGPEI